MCNFSNADFKIVHFPKVTECSQKHFDKRRNFRDILSPYLTFSIVLKRKMVSSVKKQLKIKINAFDKFFYILNCQINVNRIISRDLGLGIA
jgi:hypothetical protein